MYVKTGFSRTSFYLLHSNSRMRQSNNQASKLNDWGSRSTAVSYKTAESSLIYLESIALLPDQVIHKPWNNHVRIITQTSENE